MSQSFTSRLRRLGAGTAAILLIAGASACGGGGTDSAERGDGKMKSMLGGGNEQREDRNGGGDDRRESGDRSSNSSSDRTARIGPEERTADADQFDRRVRIVNNSGQTIQYLRGSPSSDQAWGADRIPTMTLSAGRSTIVDFDDGNGECRYDLQAQFPDGSTREQRGVNICQVSEWIVTDDGASAR